MNKCLALILLFCNLGVNGQIKTAYPYDVLLDIYEVVGNYNLPMPDLEFIDSEDKIASYNSKLNKISVEKKAIDICNRNREIGHQAMGFIIAHEIAHSLQSNSKEQNFVTDFLAFDKCADANIIEERNADIHGAFACYLAGYHLDEGLHQMLDTIYEAYGLDNRSLKNYPSKAERKQSTSIALAQMDTLLGLFDFSQILALNGDYHLARKALEHITKFYHGKEIYHNIGVYYLLEALNYGEENVEPFIYPVEMEYRTRLAKPFEQNGSKALNPAANLEREILLNNADRYFEEVLKLNSIYFPSHLNRLIVGIVKRDDNIIQKAYRDILMSSGFYENKDATLELVRGIYVLAISEDEYEEIGLNILDSLSARKDEVGLLAKLNKESYLNKCNIETKEIKFTCHKDLEPRKFKLGKVRSLRNDSAALSDNIQYYQESEGDITYCMFHNNEEYIQIIREIGTPRNRLSIDDHNMITLQNCDKCDCVFDDKSKFFVKSGSKYYLTKHSN